MAYSYGARVSSEPGMNLDLLLLGMSGSGKSATLKSIVMRDDINIHGGWKTVTDVCQEGEANIGGRTIKAVDTPGLFSTKATKPKNDHVERFKKSVRDTSQRFPGGFHALVLVMSYGRRFGQEDAQAITILKDFFGCDWLKTHGVVLVTSGDNFRFDVEGTETSFPDWCREQRGPTGEIFKECNFRCVLFDNVTNDKKASNCQVTRLVSAVDEVWKNCHDTIFKNPASKTQSSRSTTSQKTQAQTKSLQQRPHSSKGGILNNCPTTTTSASISKGNIAGMDACGNGNGSTSALQLSGKEQERWAAHTNNQHAPDAQSTYGKTHQTSNQPVYGNTPHRPPHQPTYSNIHQTQNQPTNTNAPHASNSNEPRVVDKRRLLKMRHAIMCICNELPRNVGSVSPGKPAEDLQVCVKFYEIQLKQFTEHNIRDTAEFKYFQKSISSLEQILSSTVQQNRTHGDCLLLDIETSLQPVEKKIAEVVETLEKDLDGVLTRYERIPEFQNKPI